MYFVLLVIVILICCYYLKIKYFTIRGPIPGLSPHFIFGNTIQSGIIPNGASIAEAYHKFQKRFGDVFQFWLGTSRVIVISNITDVQHVFNNRNIYDQGDIFIEVFSTIIPHGLISNKGAKYKRHAALTLPLFRRNKIISNFDLIVDCAERLLDRWRLAPHEHIHINIIEQCQHLFLLIFGFIGFDYDLKVFDANDDQFTKSLRDFLRAFYITLYSPRILSKLYCKMYPPFCRAQKVIENTFDRMIEQELMNSPEARAERKRTSLIASLVGSLQKNETAENKKREEERKGLTRSELLDEMRTFMVAGFETTATALSWFIFHMSKNPQVQQKIKEELFRDGNKERLTLERLDSLPYLDCVMKEVFRFCPPLAATLRTLTMSDCLPESGYQLYKGDQVAIPFYNLAHDKRYWSIDPELFYPERFLEEDKNHNPYVLIPFGNGHRQCIGQDLARFELKVIAATLMQHVTFGDGGLDVNSGGHLAILTIMPKHIGVTIHFDQ